jgi:nitrate reductase beta subunit
MKYLPASANGIFTCLCTWNIYLPLHMEYLPASAHGIFTCLCTWNIYLPLHAEMRQARVLDFRALS